MSQHLRSGLVTTAHKKECGKFREITRDNYLMASKLKDVQTRSNKYLPSDNWNHSTISGNKRPDSYHESVRKKTVQEDNIRLYMNMVRTRPSSTSEHSRLVKHESNHEKYRRNLGSKTHNSNRHMS